MPLSMKNVSSILIELGFGQDTIVNQVQVWHPILSLIATFLVAWARSPSNTLFIPPRTPLASDEAVEPTWVSSLPSEK
jgi:hypothetical protein